MNNFSFIGNIGNVKALRFTPSGDAVLNFSVAVNAGYGDKKTTSWANCSLWGKRAEALSPYILKGQKIGIVGELSLRSYESNGKAGTSLDVRVSDVTLIGNSGGGQSSNDGKSDNNFDDDNFIDF